VAPARSPGTSRTTIGRSTPTPTPAPVASVASGAHAALTGSVRTHVR
jgi:hypothetical protein